MSTTHITGMAQVQEPNCWSTGFPYRYLTYHPHKRWEACYKDCPLPHLTVEQAEAFDEAVWHAETRETDAGQARKPPIGFVG